MILLLTERDICSCCISDKSLNNPSGYRNMKTANTAALSIPELCVPLVYRRAHISTVTFL